MLVDFVFGFIVASIFWIIHYRRKLNGKKIGNLRIDQSDPTEKPYMFLEIYKGHSVEEIRKKETVLLTVVDENYIAQK